MPQGKTYQQIRVIDKRTGQEKVFPAGTPIDVIMAETGATGQSGGLMDPFATLSGGEQSLPPAPTGVDESISTVGKIVSLIGGLVPQTRVPKALLGMVISGVGGAMDAAGQGDNPLLGAVNEAGLTGMGAGLGQGLPRVGLRAGMAIGGVKGNTKEAAEAFMRERSRRLPPGTPLLHRIAGRGVPLAGTRRIQTRIDNVSQQLERAERANDRTQPLGVLTGAGTKITDAARDTEFPFSLRGKVNENELRFILEQLTERTGIPFSRLATGRVQPLRPPRIGAEEAARSLPGDAPTSIDDLLWSTPVSVRDLGNFKRNQAKKAEEIIRSRMSGELIPDDVATAGQVSANRAMQAKTAQEEIAPEVVPLNKRLSDLFTMKETDEALRGGGGILGDLGQMGMRGGLGAGLGGNIATITGQNNLRALMGPLGMIGLSPSNISRLGYAGGRVGEGLPTILRLANIIDEILKENPNLLESDPPPAVKRRDPQ